MKTIACATFLLLAACGNQFTLSSPNDDADNFAASTRRVTETTEVEPPYLIGISAASGVAGDVVTLTGQRFLGSAATSTTLKIGATTFEPQSYKVDELTFVIPRSVTGGTHPVVVVVDGRGSNPKDFAIIPTVLTVTPAVSDGIETSTITGYNFGSAQGASKLICRGNGGSGDYSDVVVPSTSWANETITFIPGTASTTPHCKYGQNFVIVSVDGQRSAEGVKFTAQY